MFDLPSNLRTFMFEERLYGTLPNVYHSRSTTTVRVCTCLLPFLLFHFFREPAAASSSSSMHAAAVSMGWNYYDMPAGTTVPVPGTGTSTTDDDVRYYGMVPVPYQ